MLIEPVMEDLVLIFPVTNFFQCAGLNLTVDGALYGQVQLMTERFANLLGLIQVALEQFYRKFFAAKVASADAGSHGQGV